MAYEKQTWDTGTVIPESKLLHIEDGIYDVTETADQNAEDIKQNSDDIAELSSALAVTTTSLTNSYINLTALKSGNVKAIRIYGTTSQALSSGTAYTLGTLPSEYCPTSSVYARQSSASNGNTIVEISITTGGAVAITPKADISSGGAIWLYIAFI